MNEQKTENLGTHYIRARKFLHSDLEWVMMLWKENSYILGPPLPLLNYIKNKAPNEHIIVIDQAAFIHFRQTRKGSTTLYNIAVSQDQKRKGYGKLLISYLKTPIELKTDEANQESNEFYKRLGFICIGSKLTKSGKSVNLYTKV